MRLKINVTGTVQGVGFRPFVYRIAVRNGLKGYVRNRFDAGVEILLEGKERSIEQFLKDLRLEKPPLAQIHKVIKKKTKEKSEYDRFSIFKSSRKSELSGSIIPPDIAICNECLKEMRDSTDSRYDYFFITCTNCGPRFSLIEDLPYDRQNTTMDKFQICNFCRQEYNNPICRRFHAQTIACSKCGPTAYLTTRTGEQIRYKDPVREAGKLLSEGSILAIKGYGGFHIAASTIKDEPLIELRKIKYRKAKPFAIMVRGMKAAKSFAEVSSKEEEFLASFARPIVLLNKRNDYNLSSLVSPGLHNIGVMLPYTGLHYMIFDSVKDLAFVMTSANPPNQPIIKDNDKALEKLSNTVDYFLFHNRKIAHRNDDSVLRLHGTKSSFIRRSRGYAPAPLILEEKSRRHVIGLGGELNTTSCVLMENKAFISQHIGDVENIETRKFLQEATNHLIHLTNSQVDMVVSDLHPKFTTTQLARELADNNGWDFLQVQHHHAHVAALMMEHAVDEIIGIVCDGYGYGIDGSAWGGEILFCDRESKGFRRVAHLEKQPMLGGDMATRFPLRMAAGILREKINIESWLSKKDSFLPHGKIEVKLILQQLRSGARFIETSSCGRVLDAVAAILGLCYERTYEGEPAMKLEAVALKGKDKLNLKPNISGNLLNTTDLLLSIFENQNKMAVADLAYSAHSYLARGFTTLAVEKALEQNVNYVGFSGGAASNHILVDLIQEGVEAAGLQFLVHSVVPPGDGGISFGQAVVGGFLTS